MGQLTNNQLLLSIAGLILAVGAWLKWYIDAKIDPVSKNVDMLVQYMISHEGKISKLEERTK